MGIYNRFQVWNAEIYDYREIDDGIEITKKLDGSLVKKYKFKYYWGVYVIPYAEYSTSKVGCIDEIVDLPKVFMIHLME